MVVPKKRTSRRARDIRRAHDHLVVTAAVEVCPSCGASKERHRVCAACGTYRGRQVIALRPDVDEGADTTAAE